MAYAVDTKVPIERTRLEIERLIIAHGATQYAAGYDGSSKCRNLSIATEV